MDETRADADDDDEVGYSEDDHGEDEDGTGSGGDGTVSHSKRRQSRSFYFESRKGKKTPSSYGDGGTQPKLGLHRNNPPSRADFYHLQLPQM
jgi:hypothetical protein